MDNICEELDEAKLEIEKLKAECMHKSQQCEKLKKTCDDQLKKLEEARLKIENQAQELNDKSQEIFEVKEMYEKVKCSLNEKESIVKHLCAANEMLRSDSNEKSQKLDEENRCLMLALEEANDKCSAQEQKLNVSTQEIEYLKDQLDSSKKKFWEVEMKAKAPKGLKQRENVIDDLEEEINNVEDQLKWKEQFKHLQEAHEKLRDQYSTSKKGWELEKSTFLDELSSLQTSLDSQIRISEDLAKRLEMCNQALAHEETRRKSLEVQVSDFKLRFESVFAECEEAKSQLERVMSQRDDEIASLRYSLGAKETHNKEMEYRLSQVEQENQELLTSLREFQEAQIRGARPSSSARLRKFKSFEQTHRDCEADLREKEAAWSSERKKLMADLDDCRSELLNKDQEIEEMKLELEHYEASVLQLMLQNEEIKVMLLLWKTGVYEAELRLSDKYLHDKNKEESACMAMEELETMSTALAHTQRELMEEQEKMEKQLEMYKKMYKKSMDDLDDCRSELLHKERAMEEMKLEEEEKMEKQLEMYKNMYKKSMDDLDDCRSELLNKERAMEETKLELEQYHTSILQLMLQNEEANVMLLVWKSKLYEAEMRLADKNLDPNKEENACMEREELEAMSTALAHTQREFMEEQEKMEKKLEMYKKMLEESSTAEIYLREQALRTENELTEKIRDVCYSLDRTSTELAEKICEANEAEFELQVWKATAERLKIETEESYEMRKELEASLLAQAEVEDTLKQEMDNLSHMLEDRDRKIDALQQKIQLLQQEIQAASSSTKVEPVMISEAKSLANEVGFLEQEAFRRELESAILVQTLAEKTFEVEKDDLVQLVEHKNKRMKSLMETMNSMEEKFDSMLGTFSSQLAEKQADIDLLYEAWEKIAAAEILAELEIQEKKLMIFELEDDIDNLQKKLESQLESLNCSKKQALEIEAAFEAKESELKILIHQMETNLKSSDALIDTLSSEKRNLIEDVQTLLADRENMMGLIGELDDRMSKSSSEDMQLMDMLGKILQSFDGNSYSVDLNGANENLSAVKENVECHCSQAMKRSEVILNGRSPFRQLNS